ncbi:MAG: regulatory protein RecX [Clostridiales bacterium]|nr:regulatory protein RecX [Clostridiales bacterium]
MKIISVAKRRRSLSALGLTPFPDLTFLEGVMVESPRPRQKGEEPEGDPKLLLDGELCMRKGLKPGMELDEAALAALVAESAGTRARSKALWLLSRRDYGEKELADKLQREFGEQAAGAAARRMAETGLIDDRRYAGYLARQLLEVKRVSVKQAVYQMTAKGIDRELAEEAAAALAPDPKEQIRAVLRQKYARDLTSEKGVRRAVAGLARKGFAFSDIKTVLREEADTYDYREDAETEWP